MYNPLNLSSTDLNLVVDKLIGASEIIKLPESIYKCLSTKENINFNNKINNTSQQVKETKDFNYGDYDYDYISEEESDQSHANIIKKQQQEMRKLERQEEEERYKLQLEKEFKKKKEQEEKELLDKKLEEQKQREHMTLFKRKQLPVEPPSTEPNSTHILFRFPDGVNRSERRFFKHDTIGDLYTYIESLENLDFNTHDKFELIQTFPFAIFSDNAKTLEEEKLFPNAVIQIREKDN